MLTEPVTFKDHIFGEFNSPLQLVEYGDYQCGYCKLAHATVQELTEYFGNKLCYVFRNFPLTQIHPYAEIAAETAEYAAKQGRFWEMHNEIFLNQENLSPDYLLYLIKNIELPIKQYQVALANRTFLSRIKHDFMTGVKSGVNGTPSFFINGERYNGNFDLEAMIVALEDRKAA